MATEKRLIDADDLEAQFRKTKVIEVFPNWNELPPNVKSAIIRFARKWRTIILNAPTVDAVEVVHGRTIKAEEPKQIWMDRECETCQYLMLITDNYCPNCGAKMDGDGNG